jgi:hypothetical protein
MYILFILISQLVIVYDITQVRRSVGLFDGVLEYVKIIVEKE